VIAATHRCLYTGMTLPMPIPLPRQPQNACARCGHSAYRPVLERNGRGVIAPSGRYQCAHCKLVFGSVRDWREGACCA